MGRLNLEGKRCSVQDFEGVYQSAKAKVIIIIILVLMAKGG